MLEGIKKSCPTNRKERGRTRPMAHDISLQDLDQALARGEFELHYQPKVSMITGELSGAEALLRWHRPGAGMVPPAAFIPLAEESDFIRRITRFVFGRLLVDVAVISAVKPDLSVSFNTSGKDFHDDELTQIISSAIESQKIRPDQLEIEVTETVLMDADCAKAQLAHLSALGIPIAMDDFGTGHSGLVELSKWPFTILKIDQKFVRDLNKSTKDREILQASIRMAHQLNMNVVAEGIEDEDTYRVLQEYGCRTGQGYWISRPLALQDFIVYIKDFKPLPAMPVGLLYMAQLDHMQWRKTVIDTALFLHTTRTNRAPENLRGVPEMDHTACKLGLWYYNAGRMFECIDCYRDLEQPHAELHEIGRRLLATARSGCSRDELTDLVRKLSEKSLRVLEALQTLENRLQVDQHPQINGESC